MSRPSRVGARSLRMYAAATFLLFLAGCAENKPQDYLDPAGPYAQKADNLWHLTFTIAAVIFFIVEGVLVFALFRFRHRPGRTAAQFHGNTRLEVILTAVPALILAGIAVPTVRTIFDLSQKPANALQVTVVAHQFWWEFRYPQLGIVAANELHIPTNRPVYVTTRGEPTDQVTGQAEVIHSFWVPRLSGKQDVVPGHDAHLVLEADEPGTYLGQCTEFCGLGHAYMRLRAVAQSPDAFRTWAQEQARPATPPSGGLAAQGRQLFNEGTGNGTFPNGPACASCHAVDARIQEPLLNTAPNLAHLASRSTFAGAVFTNNASNLARWIRDPSAVKDGAKMPTLGLSEDQIRAVVAYLQTLK